MHSNFRHFFFYSMKFSSILTRCTLIQNTDHWWGTDVLRMNKLPLDSRASINQMQMMMWFNNKLAVWLCRVKVPQQQPDKGYMIETFPRILSCIAQTKPIFQNNNCCVVQVWAFHSGQSCSVHRHVHLKWRVLSKATEEACVCFCVCLSPVLIFEFSPVLYLITSAIWHVPHITRPMNNIQPHHLARWKCTQSTVSWIHCAEMQRCRGWGRGTVCVQCTDTMPKPVIFGPLCLCFSLSSGDSGRAWSSS